MKSACWVAVAGWMILWAAPGAPAPQAGWKAGVAVRKITPAEPIWMSGYASRKQPAEGTLHNLWAKALALEDARGRRGVLITLDLVGIDRALSESVVGEIAQRHRLDRSQVVINCSHTHTGPVVGQNLRTMYALTDDQWAGIERYTAGLRDLIIQAADEAIGRLSPAELSWAVGHASFAVNRRNNPEDKVEALRAAGRLAGPVDHDVPVLAVRDGEGRLIATAFGYACHATTLATHEWSGDYPGFAQIELQNRHRGAVALFWAGCGGDQKPLPRRTVERAEHYGRELAGAVGRVLDGPMEPLEPSLADRYAEIDLPFASLPARDEIIAQRESSNVYISRRAQKLLSHIDSGRALSPTYPYPIQVWRLGGEITWLFLGGEVVVDYAISLKSRLGRPTTWVAGYCNDVMGYIPSLRVLREGGYEGGGAMVYYGQPSPWAESVEAMILNKAIELAGAPDLPGP